MNNEWEEQLLNSSVTTEIPLRIDWRIQLVIWLIFYPII